MFEQLLIYFGHLSCELLGAKRKSKICLNNLKVKLFQTSFGVTKTAAFSQYISVKILQDCMIDSFSLYRV